MSTPRAAADTGPLAYRPDIDGLRAVAVLGIMLFHLGVPGFGGGYVGVDVFFVVSGYLITRNIVRRRAAGQWSFGAFYGRRLRRLFPAILFTLVATFVTGFLLLSPKHFADLGQSILYTGVLAPNLFFWDRFWNRSGYFATLPLLRPLLHFWSLGVEEQYYVASTGSASSGSAAAPRRGRAPGRLTRLVGPFNHSPRDRARAGGGVPGAGAAAAP
jgi:peptidoglycan/LPS O-acetylase OafA/YrhL